MKKQLLFLLIGAICSAGALATAVLGDVGGSSNEIRAIQTTVQRYFDGIIQYDEAQLRAAFHEDASVIGTKDNGILDWQPFQSWVLYTRGTAPNPAGRNNRILSVDVSGDAAIVKTELDWPSVRYVDYLSLVKINGEWKIVNKIWHREKK